MKKLVSLMLTGLMLGVLALAGCAPAAASATPAPVASPSAAAATQSAADASTAPSSTAVAPSSAPALQPATFTLFCADSSISDPIQPGDTVVGKTLQDLTGVTLNVEYMVGQDTASKAGTMIAAGEYPDFIIPQETFATFRDAGALLPINDLLQQHGQTILKDYGKYINMFAEPDGKIYSYSPYVIGKSTFACMANYYICYGALKEAGFPKITTWEQYIDCIRSYVKNHPKINGQTAVGFTGPGEGWHFGYIYEGGDMLQNLPSTGYTFDEKNNFQASDRTLSPFRKDYMAKLNGLWKEGLLDKEIVSQTFDQYVAKVASGSVVGLFDERWEIAGAIDAIKQANNIDAYPVPVRILAPGVTNDCYSGLSTMGTNQGLCITTSCKDAVRAMQYLDRVAQEDCIKLINWGVEGQDYTLVNGKMVQSAENLKNLQTPEYMKKQGINNGLLWFFPKLAENYANYSDGSGPMSYTYSQDYIDNSAAPMEKEILQSLGWKTFMDGYDDSRISPYGLGWDITVPTDRTDLADIQTAVTSLNPDGFYQKLIMCKDGEFDKIWDDLTQKYTAIGTDKLVEYYSQEAKRRADIIK